VLRFTIHPPRHAVSANGRLKDIYVIVVARKKNAR
jgi:hypothetical protein